MDIMLFEHPPFNSKHFFVKLLNRMLFFAKIYDNTILEAFILISPFIEYYMEKKYKDCSNQILFKEIYLTEDDYINLNETLLQNGQSTKVTIDTCLYEFSNSYA